MATPTVTKQFRGLSLEHLSDEKKNGVNFSLLVLIEPVPRDRPLSPPGLELAICLY